MSSVQEFLDKNIFCGYFNHTVNRTVKYECALNFCVVNVLHSSEMLLYAVVKGMTNEGWDGCMMIT